MPWTWDGECCNLLSQLALISTPRPVNFTKRVKMEKLPAFSFSTVKSTLPDSDVTISVALGSGAVYNARSGFFIDMRTFPS